MLFEFHIITLLETNSTSATVVADIACLGIPPLWTSDQCHCLCCLKKDNDPGNTFQYLSASE